ncbi:hypothetical protein [Candidatus Protofrankia californiensis]|uniref:hypothetical protein n=1 Tax=Candidatus Protofrankia californiensis TaxID=1839754 RepID=UPI0010418BBD|nr:hypothetical protein [Candidatus Protofrankia californiensis]
MSPMIPDDSAADRAGRLRDRMRSRIADTLVNDPDGMAARSVPADYAADVLDENDPADDTPPVPPAVAELDVLHTTAVQLGRLQALVRMLELALDDGNHAWIARLIRDAAEVAR